MNEPLSEMTTSCSFHEWAVTWCEERRAASAMAAKVEVLRGIVFD